MLTVTSKQALSPISSTRRYNTDYFFSDRLGCTKVRLMHTNCFGFDLREKNFLKFPKTYVDAGNVGNHL